MAKTDKSPKKGKPTTASPDKLLKTGKGNKIEQVAGGFGTVVVKY